MSLNSVDAVLSELVKHANQKNVEGMKRFGIISPKAFGITSPVVKEIAKRVGKNQELAMQLWKTQYHEARMIATLICNPKQFSQKMMSDWCNDFDNWATCDGACLYVFCKTPHAYKMVFKWAEVKKEFSKRASFALIASLTVHDKKADDAVFEKFLPLIKKHAADERNGVKKAVNWALRQIGKRSLNLNAKAIKIADEIKALDSPTAKWIASDALRELKSDAVQNRLKEKDAKEKRKPKLK